MNNKKSMLSLIAIVIALTFTYPSFAVEIKGKVVEVEGKRAKIAYESDFAPREGDKVKIGYVDEDGDYVRIRGSWEIVNVDRDYAWSEDKSGNPGTPAKDHMAKIQSEKPQKRSDLSSLAKIQPDDDKQIKEQKLLYIPSLNAKVKELRFFESGINSPAFGQREYKRQFPSSSSRYINWELHLEHPKPNRKIDFEITAINYRLDGSEFVRQNKKTYIQSNWTFSYHNRGWGWREPGNWKPDIYRIDLYIKSQKVASGSFRIE